MCDWVPRKHLEGSVFGVYVFFPSSLKRQAIGYTPNFLFVLLTHFVFQSFKHLWCFLLPPPIIGRAQFLSVPALDEHWPPTAGFRKRFRSLSQQFVNPTSHKIRNHPQPQGRAWTTEVECQTPAHSTNPNSCSKRLALFEFFRKSAILQGKRPWRTGGKVAKIQILLFLP